jgi:hypothetical protein
LASAGSASLRGPLRAPSSGWIEATSPPARPMRTSRRADAAPGSASSQAQFRNAVAVAAIVN